MNRLLTFAVFSLTLLSTLAPSLAQTQPPDAATRFAPNRRVAYGAMIVLQSLSHNTRQALDRNDLPGALAIIKRLLARERSVLIDTAGTEFDPLARAIFDEARQFIVAAQRDDTGEILTSLGIIESFGNAAARVYVPPPGIEGQLAINQTLHAIQLREIIGALDAEIARARQRVGENHPALIELRKRRETYAQELDSLPPPPATQPAQ